VVNIALIVIKLCLSAHLLLLFPNKLAPPNLGPAGDPETEVRLAGESHDRLSSDLGGGVASD